MNYVSGLMLGASIANMLRQTLGAGTASGFVGQGMGGRGRSMQGGNMPQLGNFQSGASALSGLFGSMGHLPHFCLPRGHPIHPQHRSARVIRQSLPLSVCTHRRDDAAIGRHI